LLDPLDEEEYDGVPPFKFVFQTEYTQKPGSLIESLNKANLKNHLKQIPFSLLTILIFLPFYIPIPYVLNTAHTRAETYNPQYQTSFVFLQ
jgi:hypothetical protein